MNSPRYILLALAAATMVMAALVARFVPELLTFADADSRHLLAMNWGYILAGGLALGALNGYLTFARKPLRAE
ncbi:MAG: hypothetical protein AB1450_01720 [Pseudomonadota bacterium]